MEFCEENLDFWLACQEFRSFDGLEELRRGAMSIYEEFVRDIANSQVASEGLMGIFVQQHQKMCGKCQFYHMLRICAIM